MSSAEDVVVSSISVENVKFEEEVDTSEVKVVGPSSFSTVSLDDGTKKKRVPRRILHFSDGTLEEYSTDEDETDDSRPQQPAVDPKTMSWLPWFWYYLVSTAAGALGVADLCGEKLAWALGITSPKYQFAIDEYHRLQKEDDEERERDVREQLAEQTRLAEEMQHMEGAVELDTYNSGHDQQAAVTLTTEQEPSSSTMNTTSELQQSAQKF